MPTPKKTLANPDPRSKSKSKKLPYLQFYPGDWKKDIALQSLDPLSRYVWFECLLLMHDCEERGVLSIGNKPMTDDQIALLIHMDNQTVKACLNTIRENGVCSVREDGAIFSRKMVRQEASHLERVKNGSKGGNPDLVNHLVNQTVNLSSKHEVNHDYVYGNGIDPKDLKEGGSGETNVSEIGIIQKGKHCRISEIDLKMFEASKEPKFLDRCFELANAWVEESRGTPDFYKRMRRAQNCSALFQNWVFNAVEREFDDRHTRKARASPKQKLTTVDLNPEIFEEIFNERVAKIE